MKEPPRYYAIKMLTKELAYVPPKAGTPYGGYEVVLAADYDALAAERDELAEALMDTLNQACYHEGDHIDSNVESDELDSCALSAYAQGMHLLVRLGLAEYTQPGYGRRQFVRLLWDKSQRSPWND
jgi:hypothetical protein